MQSQSTDEKYEVNRVRSSWTCSCWDFVNGHSCCKHVYAVGFSMSIMEKERPKTVLEPPKPDMCPYCMSGGAKKKASGRTTREASKVPVQVVLQVLFD